MPKVGGEPGDAVTLAEAVLRDGYRRMCVMFQQEGFKVGGAGRDRVHRLWRRNGLKVLQKVNKHRRLGTIESGITRHAATHIDHVWTYDFVNDQTIDGRPLKILTVVDEHTRECMAAPVAWSFTSGDMVRTLAGLLATRGVPSTSAATSARSSSPSACAHSCGEQGGPAVHRAGGRRGGTAWA